jgi:hypothetical protein
MCISRNRRTGYVIWGGKEHISTTNVASRPAVTPKVEAAFIILPYLNTEKSQTWRKQKPFTLSRPKDIRYSKSNKTGLTVNINISGSDWRSNNTVMLDVQVTAAVETWTYV